MKKKNIIFNESAAYESPQIHILTFEVEGVLCDSGLGGGTEAPEPDEDGDIDFGF